jgi:threonine synthase
MLYYSTNHNAQQVTFKEALFKGLPEDNGLYFPTSVPSVSDAFLRNIERLSFQEICLEISESWLEDDIDSQILHEIIYEAIDFDAPVVNVEDNIYVLELFHGHTHAFKDFGARFMARLMAHFVKEEKKNIKILVATSGDTGSAVAHGFHNIKGIEVILLYPGGKVSELQEKQLTTLEGNVIAIEIDGTFDDCQTMVKQAFLDPDLNAKMTLSSANSINIARLIPQSFYYFYAYKQLAGKGKPIIFSVPSGNLGNLTGGLLAKRMGLPIERFVAATNSNNIVPRYLETGKFEPKASIQTISNAMDVGNPSNWPRILELYGNNYDKISADIKGWAYSDPMTKKVILQVFNNTGYILDPHSAIGYRGLYDTIISKEVDVNGIFLATAHPAKFLDIVGEIIPEEIPMPHNLKAVLQKEKKAIPMPADYAEFSKFLSKRK